MIRRTVLVTGVACAMLACGQGAEKQVKGDLRTSREQIVGGNVITDPVDLALSHAVLVSTLLTDGSLQSFGSGVVIGSKVVLTASHVVRGVPFSQLQVMLPPADPTQQGQTFSVARFVEHAGFKRPDKMAPDGFIFTPIDVAMVYLNQPITSPPAKLQCQVPQNLQKVHCISAALQIRNPSVANNLLDLQGATITPKPGIANEFVFDQNVRADALNLQWHLPIFTGLFQNIVEGSEGDSGMGCYDPSTNGLIAVYDGEFRSNAPLGGPGTETFLPLGKKITTNPGDAFAALVAPICDWITVNAANPSLAATLQNMGSSTSPLALVSIAPFVGSTFNLTIDDANGQQTFPVTISNSTDLRGLALSKFGGSQQTLVVNDAGKLVGVGVNGSAAPAILGAPTSNYTVVQKARIDGDAIDDLVAQRLDGTIDVFLGKASGLTFDATIKLSPMRLDSDPIADFVWVDGNLGVHSSSSRFGHSFLNVIATGVHLASVTPGRFRRLTGSAAGNEDIVTLGSGNVIWCNSTGGGGVECKPALDAPFISQRTATAVSVEDLTGDGLDDITISYANDSSNKLVPPRIIVASDAGFSPQFGDKVLGVATPDLNGDGVKDTVTVDNPNGNIKIQIRINPEKENPLPISLNTGIPFIAPVQIAVANVNDDGVSASALASGLNPKQDLVILSGGKIYALISNGDGTLTPQQLDGQTGFTEIRVTDANADGIADIEGKRADGSVTLYAGSSTGLKPSGDNFTGLPTPDGTDGKLLLLSGLGVDTVGATEARIRIRAAANDPASLDHLTVQVFDGDNGGFNQFDKQTNLLKTCYRLLPDPCGDGNMGGCAGGPQTQTPIVTVSSDTLHDNAWDTIFTGPHSALASMAGNGQPPFAYDLRVYLSADCSQPPAPGTQVQVATADGFKVRATGMVSMPLGEFSLVGSDSTGPFGLPNLPYMPDTNYDGTFSLPIAVGSSATEIQLKESDADSLLDSTKGVSLGANSTIQYQLLRPNGTQAPLTGGENTTATNVVTNPSGNNNGVTTFDVETRIAKITTATPGTWIWKWDNVTAANAFHLFTPPGSPTTHEVLGAVRARPTVTTAREPAFWQATPAELASELPVVLGHQSATHELEGSSLYLATQNSVQGTLDNVGGSLQGELERQLLTAKLNVQRSLALGEDINGALVYGRTVSVRTVLRAADDVVAGVNPLADDASVSQLVGLLSSINLGELNYQLPGVPFPDDPMADDDADGVVNMKDNCPTVANPFQGDSDDDRVGDACHVRPIANCVLQRSDSELEAFFGYENPLTFRAFAVGSRNLLTDNGQLLEPSQPSEFGGGVWSKAFHQKFEATGTLAWTLDGETVFADRATASCSGRELTVVDFAPQTVLFGSDSVILGENSRVTAQQAQPSVVSGGDIRIGRSSVVGNVFAGARTIVGDYGSVLGTAATGAGLSKRPSAIVASSRTFTFRPHSLTWQVNFEATGISDVIVPERQQFRLAPGDYGDVVVEPQAQLILSAGQYRFRSLTVREQGGLRVASGDAVVHVSNSFQHAGDTRLLGEASLVIGYLGSAPAAIVGSLEAAVIAPNAELTLGAAGHATYKGTFFAKAVVVSPGTDLEYFDAKR
jgi:Trypsin